MAVVVVIFISLPKSSIGHELIKVVHFNGQNPSEMFSLNSGGNREVCNMKKSGNNYSDIEALFFGENITDNKGKTIAVELMLNIAPHF